MAIIIFGIAYFFLVSVVTQNIPDENLYIKDLANENNDILEVPRVSPITTPISDEKLPPISPFVISNVYGADVPADVIKKAELKENEMITSVAYRHAVGYAELAYDDVSFNVRLNDIKGDKREITTWMPSRSYIVFNPLLNESIIEEAYSKQAGIMERREAGLSAEELAKLTPEEMKKIEEEVPGVFEKAARKFGDWIVRQINKSKAFGALIEMKSFLTYDFGVSELLNVDKPFKIGQLICYVWSFAVFIELFSLLPDGGTGGTVIKYVIGLSWLAFIGI